MSVEVLFFVAILIMSVVIHEVAHGYIAYALGDPTAKLAGRLTLNPIPHIDPLGSVIVPFILSLIPGGVVFGWAKPVPFNPYNLKGGKWGPAYVALAGPLSNIIVALFFGLLIRFNDVLSLNESMIDIASVIVSLNIVLALFNLIPIPPLDGSKVLFAILPYRLRFIEQQMYANQWMLLILVIFTAGIIIFPMLRLLFWLFTGIRI